MTAIRTEALVHVYGSGVRALDGVDLRIASGERVALVGQNGSGKTTLVRHLDGLLRPTEGRVFVGERDTAERTVAQLARDVGLVFQDPDRQIFASSVRAEVEFGPRNLGLRDDELRDVVRDALHATGLEREADTNPYDLGPSRRKLLALASVMAMRTPIIVLDEPTTGQDLAGIRLVERIIGSIADEGRTVVAVSHDMRFVADNFDRVVVMRLGQVVLDGNPPTVFGSRSWATLRTTYVEPPLPSRVGEALGLGSTPTDATVVEALLERGRQGD